LNAFFDNKKDFYKIWAKREPKKLNFGNTTKGKDKEKRVFVFDFFYSRNISFYLSEKFH